MKNLRQFTRAASFSASMVHQGARYSITVTIPDLRNNDWTAGGEWNPSYALDLDSAQTFRVTYRSARLGLISEVEFQPPVVQVGAPLFPEEREQSPCYLKFEDPERGIRFVVLFGQDGTITRTDVEVVDEEGEIESQIFASEFETQLSA